MNSMWFLVLLPVVYIAGVGMGWQWRGVADQALKRRREIDDMEETSDWIEARIPHKVEALTRDMAIQEQAARTMGWRRVHEREDRL